MPNRSAAIWKIMGFSVFMNVLYYVFGVPLILSEGAISAYHFWTPLTTGWVEPRSSPLFVILILGFVAAMKSGVLNGQMTRPRYFGYALFVFFMLLIPHFLIPGLIWSLVAEALMLVWFGVEIERRIGGRRMLLLAVSVTSISYLSGALYLLAFDGSLVSGLRPFSRGLIIVWGYIQGGTHLQMLNIRAHQIRWIVYAFIGFEILLYPSPIGLINLVGAGCIDLWAQKKFAYQKHY
jgi:hypothetical protein